MNQYIAPEMEVVFFESADILTSSGQIPDVGPFVPGNNH